MSDIKDFFISRFEDGTLMEVDYSQLEVIALAILSDDPVLKNDIMSGMDMHRVRAAQLFGKKQTEVTEKERKIAKTFSFQLQYGAGAKSMAEGQGVPIKLAQNFIDQYYDRYKRVKEWQDANIKAVRASRRPSQRKTARGLTSGLGYLESPTGRRYVFFEEDSNSVWGPNIHTSFSPTKIKNYPVQGFATADIVPIMLGELFEWCMRWRTYNGIEIKLINTVHDSILLDIGSSNKEDLKNIGLEIKDVLESAPQVMDDLFKIKIDLPLKVDVEVGKTWGSMKKLDI